MKSAAERRNKEKSGSNSRGNRPKFISMADGALLLIAVIYSEEGNTGAFFLEKMM